MCADLQTQVDCEDVAGGNNVEELTVTLSGGAEVAVIVQGYGALDTGPFTLSVSSDSNLCGDSELDNGETCDDGNTNPDDGCDACQIVPNVCGNGIVESANGEVCDDGNTTPNDGCDDLCQFDMPPYDVTHYGVPEASFGASPTVVSDTLNNNAACTVAFLSVDVELIHSYRGDVALTLTSPMGTEALLHAPSFDGTDNIIGNYPYGLAPADDLSIFEGESAVGDWVLTAEDTYPEEDDGVLEAWALNIGCQ